MNWELNSRKRKSLAAFAQNSIISNESLSLSFANSFFSSSWHQFSHIHPRKGALRRLSKVACFSGDLALLRRTTHFVRQFLRHELRAIYYFSRRETAKWITTNSTYMCCCGVSSLTASQSVIIEFKKIYEFWICALILQSDHAIFKIVVRKLPKYIKSVVTGLPVLKFFVFLNECIECQNTVNFQVSY